ncbi:MAG: hypothetical protein R3A44_24970 [Caldilineaceae bacterium]
MKLNQVLEILPPEVDRHLDELLAGWGQMQRLDEAPAEAIRQGILCVVEELPTGWWTDYYQRLNATLEKANQAPRNIASALQLQQLGHLANQIGWTPRNAPQWQPYLKFA